MESDMVYSKINMPFNQSDIIPNKYMYLENYSLDHIVSLYKNDYDAACKFLKLRPSNIIHAMFSIDKNTLYGVKKLLETKHN